MKQGIVLWDASSLQWAQHLQPELLWANCGQQPEENSHMYKARWNKKSGGRFQDLTEETENHLGCGCWQIKYFKDLRFSQQWKFKLRSSGFWCCVVLQ